MKKLNMVVLALVGMVVVTIAGSASWASAHTAGSPLVTPADPEQTTTIAQRIAQRKSTAALTLTNLQIRNIAGKCTAAQVRLKAVQAKDKTAADKRQQVYTDLASELDNIIDRLDNQNVDTAQLKPAQTKFNDAINQYSADALSYKTAVDDVVQLNCATDPQGFEATLLDARQQRTQLAKDSAQIKAQLPQLANVLTTAKNSLLNPKGAN